MKLKRTDIRILIVACLAGAAMLLPQVSLAQDAKVKTAMELLESMATRLGPPKGLMLSLARTCLPSILVQPR